MYAVHAVAFSFCPLFILVKRLDMEAIVDMLKEMEGGPWPQE